MTASRRRAAQFVLGLCFFYLSGCGYSQQEWDAQIRGAQDVQKQLREQKLATERCAAESDTSRLELEKLREHLRRRGIRLEQLADDLEQQRVANQEYGLRLAQLEALDAQVAQLQRQLEPLLGRGVRLVERNNTLSIRVPTAELFGPNRSALTVQGRQLVHRLAAAVLATNSMTQRRFQVAAHVGKSQPIAASAANPLALTALQARLVAEAFSAAMTTAGAPSTLSVSAAGYGEGDPIARNDSVEERRRNERIELVALPLSEERLNLSGLSLGQ